MSHSIRHVLFVFTCVLCGLCEFEAQRRYHTGINSSVYLRHYDPQIQRYGSIFSVVVFLSKLEIDSINATVQAIRLLIVFST